MKMLAEKDYEKQIMESGAYFLDGLKDLQKRHPEIGDVELRQIHRSLHLLLSMRHATICRS